MFNHIYSGGKDKRDKVINGVLNAEFLVNNVTFIFLVLSNEKAQHEKYLSSKKIKFIYKLYKNKRLFNYPMETGNLF